MGVGDYRSRSSRRRPVYLQAICDILEVDGLIFHRPPEPFDEDVVHAASLAVHADPHFGLGQHYCLGELGKLAALVGIHDLGRTVVGKGVLQGFDAELRVHRVRKSPGQHLARRPIHDRHEVG